MTFKATVSPIGSLDLGESARHAGFRPGQLVEVIVTRSGSLILARDDTPTTVNAPYRESLPPRRLELPEPEVAMPRPHGHVPDAEERMRIGATRIGITLEEYRQHTENGEKWCTVCQRWQPGTDMVRRRSRPDGLDNTCRTASLARVNAYLERKRAEAS